MSSNRRGSTPVTEGALLGMIVDRSSFDEDELHKTSSNEDDQFSLKKRNGRVRRKLRWKAPSFRPRRRPSSNESVGEKSHKSFHTFNSTETPIQSNKISMKRTTTAESRPSYPDTFEGVATIDSEGRYVHSRMARQDNAMARHRTLPQSQHELAAGGWDFHSIEGGIPESYEGESDAPQINDPFASTTEQTPRQRTRNRPHSMMQKFPSLVDSPSTLKDPFGSPPLLTHSSVSESSNEMESGVPILSNEDFETDRRINLFHHQITGADVAAGSGVSPIRTRSAFSPLVTPRKPPFTPEQKSFVGKPPMVPFPKRPVIKSPQKSPQKLKLMSSPEAVPAKVNINLDSPSNLNSILSNSGLLVGQHLPDMPLTAAAHKAYNRPVDTTSMASPRSMTTAHRLGNDDDSLSTHSPDRSDDNIAIITNQEILDPITTAMGRQGSRLSTTQNSVEGTMERSSSRFSIQGRQGRNNVGPVDIDQAKYLAAERNLKAIHEMAAEHLAHGEFLEALEVFEEILRGQRERYGSQHYRVGTALHNIGIVHLKSGNFDEAVVVCTEAVRVRKEALLPNHPDVAVSLAQLGVAHLECRQHREALIAFREALQIRREFLGPRHAKVGKILNNIGCALYELDELEGAKLAFEEALEIQRETLRSSPTTNEAEASASSNQALLSIASTLSNIGSIKLRWGQFEEASVSLEEALLIQQSVLGDDHPTVLSTIDSIGYVDKSMEEDASISSHVGKTEADTLPQTLSEEMTENAKCGVSQPGFGRIGFNLMQALGLSRPKRWYQKVEEMVPTPCGRRGDDDSSLKDESQRNFRRDNRIEV